MPKKKTKSQSRKQRGSVTKIWVLVGVAALLIVGVFSLFSAQFNIFKPCANSISCVKNLSGNYEAGASGVFLGQVINPPKYLADSHESNVLGETTGEKRIFVDLTNQTLYAYEGDKMIYTYPVSTGKWNHTPTGDFNIWIKLRYTRMSGGSGNDYYNLPNVPYTMFYAGGNVTRGMGYSIHGAYWHNNFGHPMSHGCINMRPEDAEKIYNWADPVTKSNTTYATADNPGTPVTVYGNTPSY